MNAIVKQEASALALSESELLSVLGSSLYPGAAPESIKMVIAYCKAAALDPMQKPVHIVPMWDSKASRMRDVVMPGINLYRTQAARSGQFAGMSEPEFGEDITENIGGVSVTFPQWCRVTVKRMLPGGVVAEFTAREYWLENYAVKGGKEKSIAPNAMWLKRPRGQLAKCASAQALRIAFPEIASQATAEEMEGKTLQADADANEVSRPAAPAELLKAAEDAAKLGLAKYQAFWSGTGRENRALLAGHHNDFKAKAEAFDASRIVEEPKDEFVEAMNQAEQEGQE